jgi:hypothetical protein
VRESVDVFEECLGCSGIEGRRRRADETADSEVPFKPRKLLEAHSSPPSLCIVYV